MTVDPDWDALQKGIAGDVVLPESPDYDAVRKPFVSQFHGVRPQAVVLCESSDDVAETLRAGRPIGTCRRRHAAAGTASRDDLRAKES